MSIPRVEVDLSKIRRNTETIVRLLTPEGIGVTGVTKAVCGHPAIAQAMLDGGALRLADARISNVQRLRQSGIKSAITLIRTPMMSQADQVVRVCDASYNTEFVVIAALAAAAIRQNRVHGIVLMVEMGDLRDGILRGDVAHIARQVENMPGVVLKGIGANFACMNGVAPTPAKMIAFAALTNEIEGVRRPFLEVVSGGGSANLPWALGAHAPGRVTELRLGEAILLGVEPLSGGQIEGMHTDAFTLVAEVIETVEKTAPLPNALSNPNLQRRRIGPSGDTAKRVIIALGHQDTDISGLAMPAGCKLIGATSDHLVIETRGPMLQVGSEVRFQMNYNALMHAMAAPDIDVHLLHDRPSRRGQPLQMRADHLALV